MSISLATSETDYAAFGVLVREYVEWCRVRFAQDSWLIDEALSHQALDRELETLHTRYGPPSGKAFLARRMARSSGAAPIAGDRTSSAR